MRTIARLSHEGKAVLMLASRTGRGDGKEGRTIPEPGASVNLACCRLIRGIGVAGNERNIVIFPLVA
jgi:hypothetical protein